MKPDEIKANFKATGGCVNFEALEYINELEAEKRNLEYTLLGVMHFVDKWLDENELKQDEVNRADTMRHKTLQIIEEQQAEIERLKALNSRLEARIKDYGRDCNSRAPIIANTYKTMLYDVKYMQTADVAEVKHGKWVSVKKENLWGIMADVYMCSECQKFKVGSKGIVKKSTYCPNCGAKMDKE